MNNSNQIDTKSTATRQVHTIADIMITDIFTLSPDMQITHAMRELLSRDYSGAPVVSQNDELVGVLSIKDCLKAAINAHYHHTWVGPVSEYMTEKVETLDASTELVSAALHFATSQYRRFPVLDEKDNLIGQVSRRDILEALTEHWIA